MKKTKTIFTFLLSAGFLFMSAGLLGQTVVQTRKKAAQEDELKIQGKTVKEADLLKSTGQGKTLRDEFIRAPRTQYFAAPLSINSWSSDKSSHLTLRKNLTNNTSTKNSKFIINPDQKKLRLSAQGSLSEGKISISISDPSGKEFQKIEIDSSADIEWSQTLGLDEENKKYLGEWKFEIVISQATGIYSFSISTF